MSSRIVVSSLAIGSAFALGLSTIIRWMNRRSRSALVSGIQGLVDKMKEYQLDARAGVIICSGSNLRVEYIDPSIELILGQPSSVEDLLPQSFHQKHKVLVRRYAGWSGAPLPDSLNHPLRNVHVVTKDKTILLAKLIIGRFKSTANNLFYVVIQPCESAGVNYMLRRSASHFSLASASSCDGTETDEMPMFDTAVNGISILRSENIMESANVELPNSSENISRISSSSTCSDHLLSAADIYGLGAASYIDCGLVPAAERYAQATVLYVDIVDFTRQCAERRLDEIGEWMGRIHAAVDELLERHAVRKVETRGDCVICVSGTNYAPPGGGASRDLCGDQATRMLGFGRGLALALRDIDGTAARMGMATGPVVLTHVAHGGDALPAKYIYGNTVNVACRMEQTGRAGAVQLSESAARAVARERGEAVGRLRVRDVKGKGPMRVALFDCAAARFVDPDSDPPAASAAAERPGGRAAEALSPGFFRMRRGPASGGC